METLTHLKSVTSTSDYLQEKMRTEKVDEGTIVWAEYQTRGRGQRGNRWEANEGENLMFSILLYPEIKVTSSFSLLQAVSLAVRDTVAEYGIEDVTVKWPNDIYVGERKVCGMIVDQSVYDGMITDAIAGIGLNVNQKGFPEEFVNPISMSIASGKIFDREEVLLRLRAKLMARYNMVLNGDREDLEKDYLRHLFRYGEMSIYVDAESGEEFEGMIVGVTDDGKLKIETATGEKRYAFKEVRYKFKSIEKSVE